MAEIKITTLSKDEIDELKNKGIKDQYETVKINKATGEVVNRYTENELTDEAKSEVRKKLTSKSDLSDVIGEYCGFYYHLLYELIDLDIANNYKTRFVMLCTYLSNRNGYLVIDGTETPLSKNELKDILKLSDREFINTFKELTKTKLVKVEKHKDLVTGEKLEFLHINPSIAKCGALTNLETKEHNFTRVFKDGIRNLYNRCKSTQHKALWYLFQIIPNVNLQHNVMCYNPEEQEYLKIKPMTLKSFCENIGYDYTKSTRLKKELLNLEIDDTIVIMFIETKAGKFIKVNPKIYYGGTRADDLRMLMNDFKIMVE